MKIYKLPKLAESNPSMEYRLVPETPAQGAVFMVYGTIRPSEPPRRVATGAGREEVFCVIKGSIKVNCGKSSFLVSSGEAFRAVSDEAIYLENPGSEEAVYLAAGTTAVKPASESKEAAKDASVSSPQPPSPPSSDDEEDEDEFEITTDDEPGPEEEKIG